MRPSSNTAGAGMLVGIPAFQGPSRATTDAGRSSLPTFGALCVVCRAFLAGEAEGQRESRDALGSVGLPDGHRFSERWPCVAAYGPGMSRGTIARGPTGVRTLKRRASALSKSSTFMAGRSPC
jgi:hypothetical protein